MIPLKCEIFIWISYDVICTNDLKHQTQKSTLKYYGNNSKQQIIPIIIAFSNLKWW